ncbi:MAG: MltR family transcriptional regulator [Acidobacteriota bacterium]
MEDTSPDPTVTEDEVFGGINSLTRSLDKLDDRGLILSLSAFAEDALGSLLKAYLIPSNASAQLLEGFNAPLGTLSARIKAAYAMGLITKEQFSDLERLRKIRNDFAHTWKPISLTQTKVATLVQGMNYSRIDSRFPMSVHEKVRSSISCLLIELRSAAHQIHKRGTQARLSGNHLIAGFPGNDFSARLAEARKEYARIQHQLETTDGEEGAFNRQLLTALSDRIALVGHPLTPEQKAEIGGLCEQVRSLRAKHAV